MLDEVLLQRCFLIKVNFYLLYLLLKQIPLKNETDIKCTESIITGFFKKCFFLLYTR